MLGLIGPYLTLLDLTGYYSSNMGLMQAMVEIIGLYKLHFICIYLYLPLLYLSLFYSALFLFAFILFAFISFAFILFAFISLAFVSFAY